MLFIVNLTQKPYYTIANVRCRLRVSFFLSSLFHSLQSCSRISSCVFCSFYIKQWVHLPIRTSFQAGQEFWMQKSVLKYKSFHKIFYRFLNGWTELLLFLHCCIETTNPIWCIILNRKPAANEWQMPAFNFIEIMGNMFHSISINPFGFNQFQIFRFMH